MTTLDKTLNIEVKASVKEKFDTLWKKYETSDFIKDDPVQFVHLFKNSRPEDIEIAGFISSLYAFGKREMFIKKLFELFNFMQMRPYEFIINFDKKAYGENFNYRFIKPSDLIVFFDVLKKLYAKDKMTLEELFARSGKTMQTVGNKGQNKVFNLLQNVCNYFYDNAKNIGDGYKFMLSNPENKGAMKRMNMFLRWMIRKNSPVDIGIWSFLEPSELLIPLDVHVGNISRSEGLLIRKQNDFKSVVELTNVLKEFDPADPVKYDFAMFGYGVNKTE